MTKKRLAIIAGILIVVAFGAYRVFFVKPAPKYVLTDVRRGSLAEYVTETGSAEASRALDLNFKSPGKVAAVLVKEGDSVKAGTPLMRLDTRELQTRRQSAASALASAQARYAQALAGASPEDLRVAQASVQVAQARVATAQQNLVDARATGSASVSAAETTLRGTLESLYLAAQSAIQALERDAYNASGALKNDILPNDSVKASQSASAYVMARTSIGNMTDDIEAARATGTLSALDPVAIRILAEARDVRDATQLATSLLQDAVPALGLTQASLDARRTDLASAWSSINTAINTAAAQRSTAASAVATAAATTAAADKAVTEAEASLMTAQAQLELKQMPLRDVDRAVYQAAVAAAQADLATVEQQLADAAIVAPEDGVVGTLDLKVGELASSLTRALSLISARHDITADVSELDIGKIGVGSSADVSFEALGSQSFTAKVTKVAPRETEKDSDVFYVTTLVLDDATAPIRPGMTADISILVGKKDDVLLVPKRLLIKRGGQDFVKILKAGEPSEVPVKVGLEGDDDVEIMQGLTIDDKLVSG